MSATAWLAVGSLLLGLLGERRYRRLPVLPAWRDSGPLPSLSVIVPARNEAQNLPRLLDSLDAPDYPGPCEVIVVDDGSVDRTAAIAEARGARVIRLNHLPPGWMGKPHACDHGSRVARGEWLLFTDADTVHAAGAMAAAVAWATAHDLDGLSLFPAQERGAPADRLLLAVAFAGFCAGLPVRAGLLNGQYILLRRAVYEQTDGFASVRGEPLEDLALGRRLHDLRYRLPIMRGEHLVRVRMYTGFRQMWHGFTRLAALSLRWSGPSSALTVLYTVGTAAPLGALLRALLVRRGRRWALVLWLVACAGTLSWTRRFGVLRWAALSPAGAAFVQAAAVWGLLTRVFGLRISWKDRPL